MPAAVAVPLIVGAASAGTAIAGAKMQSNAAKKAAGQQVASADKAQGFTERVYGDQRQLMNPYVQAGQTSLAKLMAQHWGGSPSQYQYGGSAPSMPQPPGAMAQPGASLAQMQGAPPQAQGGLSGGTVKIASPDGSEVRDIPREQASMYLAKGGKLVG